MAVVKLAILFSGRGLDYRYGYGGMKINKSLSLREIADSTKRESAPPAIDSKALAAGLNSFAKGTPGPLENFAFDELKDLALHGLTSKLPKLGPLVDHAVKTAKSAQDLANEAKKEGCQ